MSEETKKKKSRGDYQASNSVWLRIPIERIKLIEFGRGNEEREKARKFALLLSKFDKFPIESWNGDILIKRYWKGEEMDNEKLIEWGFRNK